jgi:hypothetical protein
MVIMTRSLLMTVKQCIRILVEAILKADSQNREKERERVQEYAVTFLLRESVDSLWNLLFFLIIVLGGGTL